MNSGKHTLNATGAYAMGLIGSSYSFGYVTVTLTVNDYVALLLYSYFPLDPHGGSYQICQALVVQLVAVVAMATASCVHTCSMDTMCLTVMLTHTSTLLDDRHDHLRRPGKQSF